MGLGFINPFFDPTTRQTLAADPALTVVTIVLAVGLVAVLLLFVSRGHNWAMSRSVLNGERAAAPVEDVTLPSRARYAPRHAVRSR